MSRDLLYSSRKLRRKRFFRNILFSFGLLAAIAALAALFLLLPYLRVHHIIFSGNRAIPTSELQQKVAHELGMRHFFIIRGDNLFLLHPEKLVTALRSAFPRIEHIQAEKKYPDTLIFTLNEYDIDAIWCRNNAELRCAFVGQDGVIFQEAPFFEGRILLKIFDQRMQNEYHIGESILSSGTMRALAEFRDLLTRRANARITDIRIKNDNVLELQTLEGWFMIVSADFRPDEAMNNLDIVLTKNLKDKRDQMEYIDLRFGNKLYYKLK